MRYPVMGSRFVKQYVSKILLLSSIAKNSTALVLGG